MCSLNDYLKETKLNTLNIDTAKRIHIILGNETCDLDSMICTIALGYYYHLNRIENECILPLMNTTRSMFYLRTQNVYVLKKYQLNVDDLIFVDDIDVNGLQNELKVSLVDHHVLNHLKGLKGNVIEIFDHRPLDCNELWSDSVKKSIKQVGSCCSIITQFLFTNMTNIETCDSILYALLYSAIIFDTIGFKEEAGKVKELDREMVELLEKRLEMGKSRLECFDELWQAHNDVSTLTTKQLLYKDLKNIDSVFIPGISMLINKYALKTDLLEALNEFSSETNASVIVLMGLEVIEGVVERDLALYSIKNEQLLRRIEETLVNDSTLQLESIALNVSTSFSLYYYKQHNCQPSRKQIMPMIKSCCLH